MLLTKTFGQYKKGSGPDVMESDLNIQVEYDPSEKVVEEIKRVWAYNYRYRTVTDLTAIYVESMGKATEMILESIDWDEVARETRREALVG